MSIRVLTPPQPFMVPGDIPGTHDADDETVAALIAAAVEEIDGYTGWLGRCLAPQLLEWSLDTWPRRDCFTLPIGPLLEVNAVRYVAIDGSEQTWAHPTPLYFENLPAFRGRRGDITVRYWAGYGARNQSDPTQWDEAVPARVKQAVRLMVLNLIAVGTDNLFLRSEQVEGVGTMTYTVSEQGTAVVRDVADRLLAGLKVWRI